MVSAPRQVRPRWPGCVVSATTSSGSWPRTPRPPRRCPARPSPAPVTSRWTPSWSSAGTGSCTWGSTSSRAPRSRWGSCPPGRATTSRVPGACRRTPSLPSTPSTPAAGSGRCVGSTRSRWRRWLRGTLSSPSSRRTARATPTAGWQGWSLPASTPWSTSGPTVGAGRGGPPGTTWRSSGSCRCSPRCPTGWSWTGRSGAPRACWWPWPTPGPTAAACRSRRLRTTPTACWTSWW